MQHCQVQVQFFNVANWHINVEPLLARVWTETDKQKMRKYYHLIDTKRSLAGHLLLQDMLQNCSNTKFITKRTKYDKPYLCCSNAEQNAAHFINFNTSHSGDWVCTAILIVPLQYALPHCIGIDVEQVQIRGTSSESEFLSIFQSYFTAHEWKYIYECNTLQRFFTLWTLKERYGSFSSTNLYEPVLSRQLALVWALVNCLASNLTFQQQLLSKWMAFCKRIGTFLHRLHRIKSMPTVLLLPMPPPSTWTRNLYRQWTCTRPTWQVLIQNGKAYQIANFVKQHGVPLICPFIAHKFYECVTLMLALC